MNLIGPYLLLAKIGAALALLAGLLFMGHRYIEGEREVARQEVRNEYALKLAEAKDAARAQETLFRKRLDEASHHANEREKTIRTSAAAATAASNSLRDYLAGISRSAPDASADALRDSTIALSAVLADCQGRYRELAEAADRHASDVRTLTEAWPVEE